MPSEAKRRFLWFATEALLAVMVVLIVVRSGALRSKSPDGASVWFYDESEKRLYAAPSDTVPPDKGIGGRVRAVVIVPGRAPAAPVKSASPISKPIRRRSRSCSKRSARPARPIVPMPPRCRGARATFSRPIRSSGAWTMRIGYARQPGGAPDCLGMAFVARRQWATARRLRALSSPPPGPASGPMPGVPPPGEGPGAGGEFHTPAPRWPAGCTRLAADYRRFPSRA